MDYTVFISHGLKPLTSKTQLTEPQQKREQGHQGHSCRGGQKLDRLLKAPSREARTHRDSNRIENAEPVSSWSNPKKNQEKCRSSNRSQIALGAFARSGPKIALSRPWQGEGPFEKAIPITGISWPQSPRRDGLAAGPVLASGYREL